MSRRKPVRLLQKSGFEIESLEPRRLLTLMHSGVDVFDTISIGSPNQNGGEFTNGQLAGSPGSTVTVDVFVKSSFSTEFVSNTDPDPGGTVTIFNVDTQQAVLTLGLGGRGYDGGTTPNGVNEGAAFGAASGQLTVPSTQTTFIANYSGDGNYPGGSSFSPSMPGVAGGQLTVAPINQTQLQFIQQPLDAAVGDKLKPSITVQVQDQNGAPETSSADQITLSLAPATTGTGTLGGTLTEPAVNGTATFSDLSINARGAYVLHAFDATTSTVAGVNSQSFGITDGKLVFIKAPHDGAAGEKQNPGVIVELQDAQNKVITNEDGTAVTLATIGVTGGAPLAGNTANLIGGKATFPALVFNNGGLYTVQASDPSGDAVAVSSRIKITGDHLVFQGLPKTADSGNSFDVRILVENGKNKVDTNNADAIDFSTSGFPSVSHYNAAAGVVRFQYQFGSSVPPGTYTLTAVDSTDPGIANATASVKLLGDHLVFKNLARTVDSGSSLRVRILVENSKNHVVTDNADPISFEVADGPAFIETNTAGVVLFDYKFGTDVAPGTYSLTASDTAAGGGGAVAAATASVKVLGDHLVFKNLAKTVNAGGSLRVRILVENSRNQVVTDNSDPITFDVSGSPAFAETNTAGVVVFDYRFGSDTVPGTYSLIATDTAPGSEAAVADATASIIVKGLHLAFEKLPRTVDAGEPFKFRVVLLDSEGKIDTTADDQVKLSATAADVVGVPTATFSLVDGVKDFTSTGAGVFTIRTPGNYQQVVSDLSNPGVVADGTGTTNVLSLHLALQGVHRTVVAGRFYGYKVVLLDAVGKLVRSDDDIQIDTLSADGTVIGSHSDTLTDGVRDFSDTSQSGFITASPGSYTVRVSDITADQNPTTAPPVQSASASFTVVPSKLNPLDLYFPTLFG